MNWIRDVPLLVGGIGLVLIYVDFFTRTQSDGRWVHFIAMTLTAVATLGAAIQLYLKAKREEQIGLREVYPLTIFVLFAVGGLFS